MVYGNVRLINANGRVKRGHFWYERPLFSGNVCFPRATDALNTYAENTIGSCFMYRSKAAYVLGDYSRHKHTLEDYDYWMRMNSLLTIKHVPTDRPLYLYRLHSDSLTARDRELGITERRRGLMVWDDMRRDYYNSCMIWVVEGDGTQARQQEEFERALGAAGHMLFDRETVEGLELPKIAAGVNYVYFSMTTPPFGHPSSEGNGAQSVTSEMDGRQIFAILDSKIKNGALFELESMAEQPSAPTKKISVIICTYMRGEKLLDALWSVIRQSFGKKNYEIIIVDNAPVGSSLKEQIDVFAGKYHEGFIRYMAVPQKGLSYARNAGMWNAAGQYLLFLDDDCLADYYLLEEIYSAYKYHPEAGVVGGQVILDVPFPRPEVVRKGWEPLWSQCKVVGSAYREAFQQFEFPYGANFSAKREDIWRVGGFRTCYGRVGGDYAGGEETALCFQMRRLGISVGMQPQAKVLHRVNHDRFTKEHVRNTIRAGIITSYRFFEDLYAPYGWSGKYIKTQIAITKREIKRFKRKNVDKLDLYHKKCTLAAWQELQLTINN